MSLTKTRCFVILLLIYSIHGVSIDPADYIPTDVNCEVINSRSITNSPSDEQDTAEAVISWYITTERKVRKNIKHFTISCHCIASGYQNPFQDLFFQCDTLCSASRRMTFNNVSCYDECHCRVQTGTNFLLNSNMNWSDVSTCRIGPKAPKASPVIISSPIRKDNNSIEITFKLPAEDLYCDSTDVINSIAVNVTNHVGRSCQHICDQPRDLHNDEGSYKCTFQVERSEFWRPFSITISVNNSIGSSPFSDHMIVRGANNGDITINDYKLEFYYNGNLNPEVSTLHFYWNLSKKAEHLMDSQFITGFKIVIEHEPGNDTISTISLTQNSTLNIILEPNQWYLIIGRILTEDNDTWGPEPVYEYFQTPGLPEHSSPSSDNNCLLVIILSIMILVTILVVTVLLYITRAPKKLLELCHNDYDDDDSYSDKMTEVIGTVAGSYAEHRCDPSTVENISNGGFISKNQDDSTTDDFDNKSYIDECDISILKITAV